MAERTFQFGKGGVDSRVVSRLLWTGFPVANQQTSFFFPLSLYRDKAINLSSLPVCPQSSCGNLKKKKGGKTEVPSLFMQTSKQNTKPHLAQLAHLLACADSEAA